MVGATLMRAQKQGRQLESIAIMPKICTISLHEIDVFSDDNGFRCISLVSDPTLLRSGDYSPTLLRSGDYSPTLPRSGDYSPTLPRSRDYSP